MRRITSFVLLLMLTCIPIWAQPTNYGEGLITDVSQLYSTCGDEQEGTDLGVLLDGDFGTFWHTDWHGKVEAPHWIQINLDQPVSGNLIVWMKRRANNDNGHPSRIQLTYASDADFTNSAPIGEYEISNPTGGADGETPKIKLPRPVQYLRITVPTINSDNKTAGFWHAAELQLYCPNDESLLQQKLMECLTKYDRYLYEDFEWAENDKDFGKFTDKENGALFRTKLNDLDQLLINIENGVAELPSAEEIDAIIAELDEIYQKVMDSEVLYQLDHKGYYRIVANYDYYKTVETGEIDEDTGEPITEKQYGIVKSMYSELAGYGSWHTYDAEDCRDIWYLEQNPDSSITMYNAATDMGFIDLGSPVTMGTDPETWLKMRIDFAGREEANPDRDIIYIRNYETARDKTGSQSIYLHQKDHGQGAGEGSRMCLWVGTFNRTDLDKGTSEWYLEPVSDEEAQALIEAYAPFKDHDKVVLQYQEILADAKAALAVSRNAPTGLITKGSQFSSKVSDADEGKSFDVLLDGDGATFWHTTWHVKWGADNNNWPMGTHFFDVKMEEPIKGDVSIYIQRRGTSGSNDDNPTRWNVYGSNDEAALEAVGQVETATTEEELLAQTTEGWTLIKENLETPWEKDQREITSEVFNIPESYKYLRFACTGTLGPNYQDRGYFHMGGFQLHRADLPTQFEHMGDVATNLQTLVDYGDNVDTDDITYDDVANLTNALEAFKTVLVDPTELRKLINDNRSTTALYAQGTEPGYWTSDAEAVALDALLATADAYDIAANYTQAQTDKYVEDLTAAVDAFRNGFIPVDPNVWYRIKFKDEAIYDANNWDKGNCALEETNNLGALFGQYVTVGTYMSGEDIELPYIEVPAPEDIRFGNSLFFADLDLIGEDNDASLFRFVNVGDTAYMMQNKATGLFINCLAKNNNEVTLSADPTLFKLAACGKGGVIMHGYSVGNEDRAALHAQRWNHRLVTWADYGMSSNTGLLLETVAPVDETEFSFQREARIGAYSPECWPLALTAEDGVFYEAAGTYTDGDGKHWLALNTVEQSRPGVPFLYIYGNTEDLDEDEVVTDPVTFSVLYDEIATRADSIGGMVGTYSAVTVAPGITVFTIKDASGAHEYNFETGAENTCDVAAHSAYVNFGTVNVEPGDYDLTIEITGEITDGIQDVISKVAKSGRVYTLDGKLVRQNATINDLKALGTGTYILNGVKVRVK